MQFIIFVFIESKDILDEIGLFYIGEINSILLLKTSGFEFFPFSIQFFFLKYLGSHLKMYKTIVNFTLYIFHSLFYVNVLLSRAEYSSYYLVPCSFE